jgi:hypothetical protein
MKTKMLLLALTILGTSLVYSQNPDQITKTKCEKKVLKSIKRKMNSVNFIDYVSEGSKTNVALNCILNEKNIIEVTNIEGGNDSLNAAILEMLENHPVKCEDQPTGTEFTFKLTFKHIPS